jgi:glycine cleavage system aminomethyltransferase T
VRPGGSDCRWTTSATRKKEKHVSEFEWMGDTGGLTPANSVQDALDWAGGAVTLLWKPGVPPIEVPRVPREYVGWADEQRAWEEGVALLEVSHHMADLFVEGPDALRLLSWASANNYQKFAVGQAKQLITVTDEGWLLQDAIITRTAADKFIVTGIGSAANWVAFHAASGEYEVDLRWDLSSDLRQGDPVLFRLQVQGPKAAPLLATLFGDALDDIKFFHYKPVTLEGREFNALRHGMAGQAGFEFWGSYEHHDFLEQRLLEAGAEFGLVRVGGKAYYTAGVDSGWLATPIPGIYTSAGMADFRRHVSAFSFEGMNALRGSFCSPDIEDYYVNPFELGYGRSISFNHDFFGREALLAKRDDVRRTKVTLVWDSADVDRVFGSDRGIVHSYTKDRVEVDGTLVGLSEYATSTAVDGTVHSLARVDLAHAEPGTEVTVVWGDHPGPGKDADPSAFERLRAVVAPAPYTEYARKTYRDR